MVTPKSGLCLLSARPKSETKRRRMDWWAQNRKFSSHGWHKHLYLGKPQKIKLAAFYDECFSRLQRGLIMVLVRVSAFFRFLFLANKCLCIRFNKCSSPTCVVHGGYCWMFYELTFCPKPVSTFEMTVAPAVTERGRWNEIFECSEQYLNDLEVLRPSRQTFCELGRWYQSNETDLSLSERKIPCVKTPYKWYCYSRPVKHGLYEIIVFHNRAGNRQKWITINLNLFTFLSSGKGKAGTKWGRRNGVQNRPHITNVHANYVNAAGNLGLNKEVVSYP